VNRRTFLLESLAALASLGASGWLPGPPASARPAGQYGEVPGGSGQEVGSDVLLSAREGSGSSSSRRHVVIIGGGVAGLAAAASLARANWKVDLFEQREEYGGFCATKVIDGFTFDLGPHVFGNRILNLAPFRPLDLDPATFSELFLLQGRLLSFPLDLLFEGYLTDIITTIAKNARNSNEAVSTNMPEKAAATYGRKINQEIFRPLIEKWCQTPMSGLDARYLASRMHSKLEINTVIDYLNAYSDTILKYLNDARRSRAAGSDAPRSEPATQVIPPAPGYAGSTGARIVPARLAGWSPDTTILTGCPVTAIGVENRRVVWMEAGDRQVRPDFVISTIPLNRLAGIVSGINDLKALREIAYLNIMCIFVRIARPGLLRTEWTWIPDPGIPFYRMSEMKVLNKRHAPEGSTGLCLEVSFIDQDRRFQEPDQLWEKLALDFLDATFSVKKNEVIGVNIERRTAAYPNFNTKNTGLISRHLKRGYQSGESLHEFNLPVANLALAGRAGAFVYLLTPEAILSGVHAARQAAEYFGEKLPS